MLQMNRQQAVLELVLLHPLFNFARELAKPAAAGRDGQFMEGLAQHFKVTGET
jgi:hypothetical protein